MVHDGEERAEGERPRDRFTAASDSVGGMSRPETLGELIASGWESRTVAEEIRTNAAAKIAAGEPLFDAVLGYEDTVLPQLENALLAGHDVIFLGERGQAKTRMIRSLTGLLDEWMPIVAGSEINDDPLAPVSRYARDLIAEFGDSTRIEWVNRDDRYGEKLATPDTSIADLIGEVDPIKVAEGRYLSDELTLHYGLVPRTNRGIFAINELPDLAERIQVGLLNVLEERDIQVRGYKIRLPLDVMLVASANPEDYTNRGRLITPLKDRFGSQIRTHYPLDVETEVAIVHQEATLPSVPGVTVHVPDAMTEIIATLSQLARESAHVNQRSGVSVRLSVSNEETMVANAMRRALRAGETEVVPRVCDLEALPASTSGKVEIESLEDGREGQIVDHLIRSAILMVFRERVGPEVLLAVVEGFDGREPVETGEDVPSIAYVGLCETMPALASVVSGMVGETSSPARVASAVEFVLEGLHLSKRLNKEAMGGRAQYRARG
jgi:magnesium chelatase subunit I